MAGFASEPLAMVGGANSPIAMAGGANTPIAMAGGANAPIAMAGGANTPTAMASGANTPTRGSSPHPIVTLQPGMSPQQTGPGPVVAALMQDDYGAQPLQGIVPVWMPVLDPIPGVPTGLEYLAMVDTIMIFQQMEPLEFMTGYEISNKYRVTNAAREQIYFAVEESAFFHRKWYGNARPFTMHVIDNAYRDVMIAQSPKRIPVGGYFGCSSAKCFIEAPPTSPIAAVQQRQGHCSPNFAVMDESGNPVLKIKAPFSPTKTETEFSVLSMDNTVIGSINRHWGGLMREMMTDADIFSATFPLDLDVRAKAALLGATFLIDFMLFEEHQMIKEKRAKPRD